MNFYRHIIRPALFCLDAEKAHHVAMGALRLVPPAVLQFSFSQPRVSPTRAFGLTFPNRVGLAAGMDKNAIALPAWEALGFGFVEVGTVTAHPQPGNEKPRCFRYPDQSALINRMGFNNEGAIAIAARLATLRSTGRWPKIPVGINLGKSKITPLADAAGDYAASYRHLLAFGDYFVINVSSPNTPGLRTLQDPESLLRIVEALRNIDATRPLLVKIAPDLSDDAVQEMAVLAQKNSLDGVIATNTTLDHSAVAHAADELGGLSGSPLRARATEVVRLLRTTCDLPIIASGGIMSAEDGAEKLAAGACLVQIYTGFVYRGPQLIGELARLT